MISDHHRLVSSDTQGIQLMETFLQGSDVSDPVVLDEKSLASRLALQLDHAFSSQPLLERAQQIELLGQVWHDRRKNPTAIRRYAAWKQAMRGPWEGWQERLLGLHWVPQLRLHHGMIEYSPDLAVELETKARHRTYTGSHHSHAGLLGSSFSVYHSSKTSISAKKSVILDAAFSAMVLNAQGEIQGFVMGLGDGAGGHLGDEAQDRAIGRAAYFASKQACRLLAACKDAKMAKTLLPDIVHAASQTLQRKTKPFMESTTLSALRGFYTKGDQTMEVVGFQIGDLLLLYWHPATQTLKVLAPARQWESESGQQATALVPHAYKASELRVIYELLPLDGVFLGGSDGGYEMLPMQLTKRADAHTGFIRDLSPDDAAWKQLLKGSDSARAVVAALWRSSITAAEDLRRIKYAMAEKTAIAYIKDHAALSEREEKIKDLAAEERTKHRRSRSWQSLREAMGTSASILSQSRLGDDVLWCAVAWPTDASRYDLKPTRSLSMSRTSEEKKQSVRPMNRALSALEEKRDQLAAQRRALKEQMAKKAQGAEEQYQAIMESIKTVEAQIKILKKYPNPFFRCIEPALTGEPGTPEAQKDLEDRLLKEMKKHLETAHQDVKTGFLNAVNDYEETILALAVQGKCFRLARLLLDQVELQDKTVYQKDIEGQNLAHLIVQKRLLSAADERLALDFLAGLYERGCLLAMLQEKEPRYGYTPLHLAVEKAAETQQLGFIRHILGWNASDAKQSVCLLQQTDYEGQIPLHTALITHGRLGSSLPVIDELLKSDHLCPLHTPNRAGQSPFDMAAALSRSSHPTWGEAVRLKLDTARSAYQKRLLGWGFMPVDEKKTSERTVEEAFEYFYREACKQNPTQATHFAVLYQRYCGLYQPLIQRNRKAKDAFIERIQGHESEDLEEAHAFQEAFQTQRAQSVTPPSAAQKAAADFYQDIAKRAIDASRYEKLWRSVGEEIDHWPLPDVPDVQAAKLPLPVEKRYLMGLLAIESAKTVEEKWMLAKQVVTLTHPTASILASLQKIFPGAEQQANLLSSVNWETIEEKAQSALLKPLYGASFRTLTLRRYRACQALSSERQSVWRALFQKNPGLETLELLECDGVDGDALAMLAQGCPNLQKLMVRGIPVQAFEESKFLGFSSKSLTFPSLEHLELLDCKKLIRMDLHAQKLHTLDVSGCVHLEKINLHAPKLSSIRARETRKWHTLTIPPDHQALAPLADTLKAVHRDGLSAVLSPTKGLSRLHKAAEKGQLSLVQWWVDLGTEFNQNTPQGETALHLAAKHGYEDVVRCLVLCPKIDVLAGDRQGQTALHKAAQQGHAEVISILCHAGADPFARNHKGRLPIDLARFYRPSPPESAEAYANIENQLSIQMFRSAQLKNGDPVINTDSDQMNKEKKERLEYFLNKGTLIPFVRKKIYSDSNCLFHVLAEGIKTLDEKTREDILKKLEKKEQDGSELKKDDVDDKWLRRIAVKLFNEQSQDEKSAETLVSMSLISLLRLDDHEYDDILRTIEKQDKIGNLEKRLSDARKLLSKYDHDEKQREDIIRANAKEWLALYRDLLATPEIWGGEVELTALEDFCGIRLNMRQQITLGSHSRKVQLDQLKKNITQERDEKISAPYYRNRIESELRSAFIGIFNMTDKEKINTLGSNIVSLVDPILQKMAKKDEVDKDKNILDQAQLEEYVKTPEALALYYAWFAIKKIWGSHLEKEIYHQCIIEKYRHSVPELTQEKINEILEKGIALEEVYLPYHTERLQAVTPDRQIPVVYTGSHYDLVLKEASLDLSLHNPISGSVSALSFFSREPILSVKKEDVVVLDQEKRLPIPSRASSS